ncbi:phosphopantetheine-binding protein, partial [Snuella sedimenti]
FVSNPFIEGERIYKTGDLARWLPDGELEYLGRKDDQVKIRGYRIELGEIENVLSQIEGVKGCCVLAKEDTSGSKRLVGYVVASGAFDKDRIQESLKNSLPEYMVPMVWVEMESMPLTSSGKLDKKDLPDPDGSQLSTKVYVAPRNEIEAILAVIWETLLGVGRVGVYDNFFELGGHSLLAVRMISRMNKDLDIKLDIITVFKMTTISLIAEHIALKKRNVKDETKMYRQIEI